MSSETGWKGAGERCFRWRGGAVSRIEALSDAVFALALTLIVVTLEVPRTWVELREAFVQAPVFAACFAILAWCWWIHFRFHRRFGLEDQGTTILNLALLFVILLYVYPLKFLFSFVYNVGILGRTSATMDASGALVPRFESQLEVQRLMWIYGAGFIAIFAAFSSLYLRAWRLREELGLDQAERWITRGEIRSHALSIGVGLLSLAIASASPTYAGLSGLIYGVLGPLHGWHGWYVGRGLRRVREPAAGA